MFPVIETKRLRLRALTLEDDAFILKLRSHPDIVRFVDMKPYEDIPRARRFIAAVTKDIEDGEALFWGILDKAANELVGTVCLWNFEPVGNLEVSDDAENAENAENAIQAVSALKAELGYEVHPDAQGKGYAKEAVGALLEYAMTASPIVTVDAITHKDNVPSRKLLEGHAFSLLGIAAEVEPELEEGPEMLLYRIEIKR